MATIVDIYHRWAVNKCNDAHVGYSQAYRNQQRVGGITYYDCSSFVWFALKAAGFPLGDGWPFTTFTMGSALKALGFTEMSTNRSWLPGDILVRNRTNTQHTEIVYDTSRRTMGAHTDGVPLADQVSITSASTPSQWDKLYRYQDGGGGDGWSVSWVTRVSDNASNANLNGTERANNAMCVYSALHSLGWSDVAIAGALGNMETESTLNPGACEYGRGVPGTSLKYPGGLGLIQWTDYPAYAGVNVNPVLWYAAQVNKKWSNGTFQCQMLNKADDASVTACGMGDGPRWGWQTSSSYPSISFSSYKSYTGSASTAAEYWYYDMEMHSTYAASLPQRKQQAQTWLTYIQQHRDDFPTDPDAGGGAAPLTIVSFTPF